MGFLTLVRVSSKESLERPVTPRCEILTDPSTGFPRTRDRRPPESVNHVYGISREPPRKDRKYLPMVTGDRAKIFVLIAEWLGCSTLARTFHFVSTPCSGSVSIRNRGRVHPEYVRGELSDDRLPQPIQYIDPRRASEVRTRFSQPIAVPLIPTSTNQGQDVSVA